MALAFFSMASFSASIAALAPFLRCRSSKLIIKVSAMDHATINHPVHLHKAVLNDTINDALSRKGRVGVFNFNIDATLLGKL